MCKTEKEGQKRIFMCKYLEISEEPVLLCKRTVGEEEVKRNTED